MSIDDASVARHPQLGIAFPRESDRPPTELERLAWKFEEDDYRGVSFFAQLIPEIKEKGYIFRAIEFFSVSFWTFIHLNHDQ